MRKGLSRTGERGVAQAVALPVLLLMVLAGYAAYQAPPAGQDRDSESFRISVDVALVVLPATVTDRQGGFVSNLGEQDFEVYENGVKQHIRLFRNEDIPVTQHVLSVVLRRLHQTFADGCAGKFQNR